MADHVNNATGYAFPAAERLARQMHLSAKTVRRALASLLRHGYLKVGPRMYKSVTYILTLNHRPVPTDVHSSDKLGSVRSQNATSEADRNDQQTYNKPTYKTYGEGPQPVDGESNDTLGADIKNLCRSFFGKRARLFDSPDRERYEPELRERLGEKANAILAVLPEHCTEQLLQLVRSGSLMTRDILLAHSIANQVRERAEG